MNKQEELELAINKLQSDKSELQNRIILIDNQIKELHGEELKLFDPHALIPNSCKTFEDWIKDHPFPDACLSMIYRNKQEAKNVSYCCYTYQYDYHIVRIRPEEKEYLAKTKLGVYQHEQHSDTREGNL